MSSDKAILTCALTGVLTDPAQHPVPVTPEEMAAEAKQAYDAGASILHVHFRRQEPGKGSDWYFDAARRILAVGAVELGGLLMSRQGQHDQAITQLERAIRFLMDKIEAEPIEPLAPPRHPDKSFGNGPN